MPPLVIVAVALAEVARRSPCSNCCSDRRHKLDLFVRMDVTGGQVLESNEE